MTVSVRPWETVAAELRDLKRIDPGAKATVALALEAAVAGDALAAEVARLSGADACEVCGSTSPAVRIIMPDNVGRRLFPDVPDVHEMTCYWDWFHDPQKAIHDQQAQAEYEEETHSALTAVVAAVHTALDTYYEDLDDGRLRNDLCGMKCVSAIAKAVER